MTEIDLTDLYPCNGCGKWCIPWGMTLEGQALCASCQEQLYAADGDWGEYGECAHEWVPNYEGCDHYHCQWCGADYR